MTEPSFSRNRRSNGQDGVVVVVRDHLQALLEKISTPFPCRYACFIHPRRRAGEHGFGTITLAGESLPLTVVMLESLRRMPTLLEGTDPVVLGAADEEDALVPGNARGEWVEPLPVNRLMLWHGVEAGAGARTLRNRTGIMLTPKAAGPQLTLLCAERPVGWPA
jgi:hypothetical protein